MEGKQMTDERSNQFSNVFSQFLKVSNLTCIDADIDAEIYNLLFFKKYYQISEIRRQVVFSSKTRIPSIAGHF